MDALICCRNFVLQVTAVGHCNLSDVKCVSDETYFVLGAFTEIKGNQLSLKYYNIVPNYAYILQLFPTCQ